MPADYYNILATGEALFTTFYALAVQHRFQLGLFGADLLAVQAIAAEEQLHLDFAKSLGGTPATDHFSFPHGADTFTDAKGVQHNWRADLIAALAKRQKADGSWVNENDRWMEGDPNLVTGYALMALSYCQKK